MPLPLIEHLAPRALRAVACGSLFFSAAQAAPPAWPTAELGHPLLRNIAPGEHMRNVVNNLVAQDAAGFMLFSSGPALLTFDGTVWKSLPLPPETVGVRQFATTADGTIFLGGPGVMGFLRGTGFEAEFVSLRDQLPVAQRNVDELRYVVALGNAVCFSDGDRILIWRDGRFRVVPYPTLKHSHGARLHRVGETVYVTALERPLCRLIGDGLEVVADDPVLRKNQIVAVEAGAAPGTLVLLTAERGFFQLESGRVAPLPFDANRWLAGKRIFRALRLADGSHVVAFSAVSGDGGMRFAPDGTYIGPIDRSTGVVVARALRDFFCDREGGLWLGTENGTARLEWPSPASIFDVVNGLGQGMVTDLVRHEGVLYCATTEGVFRLVAGNATDRVARFERVVRGPCHSLASHPAGLLALGYAELFAGTAAGLVSVAKLPPGGGVLLRMQGDRERVWVGTSHGILTFRATPRGWQQDGALPGFEEGCRALSESSDGSLWIASQAGGLFRARAGQPVERIAGAPGLPSSREKASLFTWAGEPVFVFGGESRPFRFDAARGSFEPLPGTAALQGEADGEGWIANREGAARWLANERHVFSLPRDGGEIRRLPRFMVAPAGSITRLLEEEGPDGRVLWLGGTRGLVRVDLARAFVLAVPFATQLQATNVRAGGRLGAEHPPIGFRFVAPRQRLASEVTYQTRLVGREREWSEWSASRERSFPHLPPGSYRFEARARDADGVVSAPGSLAFVVLAPWWRTWWALLAYAGAGAGLIAAVVRVRTRSLRLRAARLEQVIAERTAELADKNRELTRLHQLEFDEKVAARLAEEKARLEVLRYQLNPHFLFNTLASISSSLPNGRSPARTMLDRLADFCRLTLHRADERDWTTLGEEMHLLRAYLEIEQSRWGELLAIEIRCAPAVEAERLPYFLLLPIVENALKYGRATSPDRVAIRLEVRCEDDDVVIEVANTGEWVEPTARSTVSSLGIGLENLRERLARHFPGAHQLSISRAPGWVTVTLRLARRVTANA